MPHHFELGDAFQVLFLQADDLVLEILNFNRRFLARRLFAH